MKNLLITSTLFLIVNFSFAQTENFPFMEHKMQNDMSKPTKGKVSFMSVSIEGAKFTINYDEKGNMIETNTTVNGKTDKSTYKYNEKGKLIETNSNLGGNTSQHTYKYNEKGKLIETNGTINGKTDKSTYTYNNNDKGNMIEMNTNASGIDQKYTYKYDEKGNMIEENTNIFGKLMKCTYKYDEKGNVIERNDIYMKYTHKYDEKGNVIETNITDRTKSRTQDALLVKYEYEFDAMGNWIKKTTVYYDVLKGSLPERALTERVIKYYDKETIKVETETTKNDSKLAINNIPEVNIKDTNLVLLVVEVMPSFPGGADSLNKFIQKNIIYPANGNGKSGKIYTNFVVEKDGSLTSIQATGYGLGTEFSMEAIRVLKSMPKWNPGKNNGKAARVKFNMPINFFQKK